MEAAPLKHLLLFAGVSALLALSLNTSSKAITQKPAPTHERRGKEIYTKGTSPSGKDIFAYVGETNLEVSGSAMPCSNCHGLDRKGKPEGSIIPSNLIWEELTKPYGVTHADGRKHPPYTERGLELAITRGIDPAGNKLARVMPRYQMAREDLADLISYLSRAGKDLDPGISDDRIIIGTAFPGIGPLFEIGQAAMAVISAFFDDVNGEGGIYGRRIDLKVAETGNTPSATRANVERLIADERVFALTGALIAGADKEIASLVAQQEVPLIGPLTLAPQTGFPLNRQVFYITSGINDQARATIDFFAGKPDSRNFRIGVVYQRSDLNAGAFEAIKEQCKSDGLVAPLGYEYQAGVFDASEIMRQLIQVKRDIVVFLGVGADAGALMKEADRSGWRPSLVLLGGSAEAFSAPPAFNRKLFVPLPTSPADQTSEGVTEFAAFAEKHKLPNHHTATQISVYSAAKVLVEALRRSGKDLSREKLINTLEAFYEYATGLTPPITYGTNRRIGARGAYVLTIDLEQKRFVPVSGWINVK